MLHCIGEGHFKSNPNPTPYVTDSACPAPQAWGVLESQAGNYQLARRLFRCAVKAFPQSEPSWKVQLLCHALLISTAPLTCSSTVELRC